MRRAIIQPSPCQHSQPDLSGPHAGNRGDPLRTTRWWLRGLEQGLGL